MFKLLFERWKLSEIRYQLRSSDLSTRRHGVKAARALIQSNSPLADKLLTTALNSEYVDVRRAVVKYVTPSNEFIAHFKSALDDDDEQVRQAAVKQLGGLHESEATTALLEAAVRNPDVAAVSIDYLADRIWGNELIRLFRSAMQIDDWKYQKRVVETLAELKTEWGVELLLSAHRDPIFVEQWDEGVTVFVPEVRHLEDALVELGDIASDQLIRALQSDFAYYSHHGKIVAGTPSSYHGLTRVVARCGNRRTIPALVDALADQRRQQPAREALVALSWDPIDLKEQLLFTLTGLEEKITEEQQESLEVLAGKDPVVTDLLIAILKETEVRREVEARNVVPQMPCRAARVLGLIRDKKAVEPLLAALQDAQSLIRQAATEALGCIGDVGAVDSLLGILENTRDSRNEWAQDEACVTIVALRRIRDARSLPALIALAKRSGNAFSPNRDPRKAAVEALGYFGGAEAVDTLIRLILNRDNPEWITIAAADSLAQIGDARAVDALLRLLKDAYPDEQIAAARALGALGDRRAIEPLRAALKDEYVKDHALRAMQDLEQDGVDL